MPITAGHSRTTFSGTLPGGEIFGWSIWTSEAPATVAAAQTQADAYAAAFGTSLGPDVLDPVQLLNTGGSYKRATVYGYLDGTGHASVIATSPCVHPGSSSAHTLPNQCAVVVSLRTALAGRTNKGRIYLPVGNMALDSNGQLPAGDSALIVSWAKRFLDSLNTIASPGKVEIFSTKLGTGTPITTVAVDSRVDIQRRRANRQGVEEQVSSLL
jgi:hypothetical protein